MEDHHLGLDSPPDLHNFFPEPGMQFGLDQDAGIASLHDNVDISHETHATGKFSIHRWADGVDPGPWHPRDLASGTENGNGQSMVPGTRGSQFMVSSQSNVTPMGNIQHSDSGYASYDNRRSIANGSICDGSFDTNPDTHSIIGEAMGMSVTVPDLMVSEAMALGVTWVGQVPIEAGNMKCKDCGKPVKTKSEMKKHEQRHKKPFKCNVKDCLRQNNGFSTVNDLDRHKRSVHPGNEIGGKRYTCSIDACANKHKIWPRADNFKAHLKRIHGVTISSNDGLMQYIHKPSIAPDELRDNPGQESISDSNEYSRLANVQANNWTPYTEVSHSINQFETLDEDQEEKYLSPQGPQRELVDLQVPPMTPPQEPYHETTEPGLVSCNPVASSPMQHSRMPQKPEIPEPASPTLQEPTAEAAVVYSIEASVAGRDAPGFTVSGPPSESVSRNSPAHSLPDDPVHPDGGASDFVELEGSPLHSTGRFNLDFKNPTEMKELFRVLESNGLLEQYGYEKRDSEATEPTETEHHVTSSQDRCHHCPKCSKSFRRKCELKKHQKRHEKPYGCTMPGCDKKFGSKNDWKRHENTQHFVPEIRRCGEVSCNGAYSDLDSMSAHLQNDHNIADHAELKAKLERCRVETQFLDSTYRKAWKHTDPLPSIRGETHSSLSHLKAKRKRDDGTHSHSSKKGRHSSSGMAVVCCSCADLVTASQLRCHYPCEHIPCVNCKRV